MSDETINTMMPHLDVQCPRCGAQDVEYLDDLEWDLEQHRCNRCGKMFNVRWVRDIQVIGFEDDDGVQHDLWNADLIIAAQSEAMYHVCHSLWKAYGNHAPPGVEQHVWNVLLASMDCIEAGLPQQEHQFKPVALGDQPQQPKEQP